MRVPKKSLGQNFLIDKNICKKIVKLIKIKNKRIIEIGPGYGILTDEIIKREPKELIIIEKDDKLYEILKSKYKLNKKVIVINNDVLRINFNNFNGYNIVSNLPYNISTKFILKILTKNKKISQMVVMIQKEVALKLSNKIKLNKYNFLVEICSKYIICFDVSPNVFYPKPKVTSSVVIFEFKKKDINWIKLNSFVNLIFQNKRKKILNKINIKSIKNKNILNQRVEELNFNQLLRIYNLF